MEFLSFAALASNLSSTRLANRKHVEELEATSAEIHRLRSERDAAVSEAKRAKDTWDSFRLERDAAVTEARSTAAALRDVEKIRDAFSAETAVLGEAVATRDRSLSDVRQALDRVQKEMVVLRAALAQAEAEAEEQRGVVKRIRDLVNGAGPSDEEPTSSYYRVTKDGRRWPYDGHVLNHHRFRRL
ncbi:hypothetical protein K488DRAFT_72848 [Vararia minispora EC-137]|uniref:Uncharacterized protein n=1 Tax=Vararia minispora EC-137 TaxID=1314806 RepID=A0ACB8QD19_9AGAM|nr:hypothetical protein K488DRAFT_72848 [Vararia minispora EC-137]